LTEKSLRTGSESPEIRIGEDVSACCREGTLGARRNKDAPMPSVLARKDFMPKPLIPKAMLSEMGKIRRKSRFTQAVASTLM